MKPGSLTKPSKSTRETKAAAIEKERRLGALRALDRFVHYAVKSGAGPVVKLLPADTVPFQLNGKVEYVTNADVGHYANQLIENNVAERVLRKGRSFIFMLTPSGVNLMRSSSISSRLPVHITDESVTTANSSRSAPGTSGSKSVATKIEPSAKRRQNSLPSASDMCLPILTKTSKPIKFRKLMLLVLKEQGVTPGSTIRPSLAARNQTFLSRMQAAIEYLIKREFLTRSAKQYLRTQLGTERSLDRKETFEGIVEPPIKRKGAELDHPQTHARRILLDAEKVIARFSTAETDELLTIRENASRIVDDPGRRRGHSAAQAVLDALEREFTNRGKTGPDDKRFKWPSTDAPTGRGELDLAKALKEGMLSRLGYHVGRERGEHRAMRWRLLTRIFEKSLPPVFVTAYMDEWGKNASSNRLRKIAECIASFTRSAKRRDPIKLDEAIRQWEEDLAYLYERYYVGKFHFGWPLTTTEVYSDR